MTDKKTNDATNYPMQAVKQLADTFGSPEELLELFDGILSRITLSYSGNAQSSHDLVGDYDFINELKHAFKTDLQEANPTQAFHDKELGVDSAAQPKAMDNSKVNDE